MHQPVSQRKHKQIVKRFLGLALVGGMLGGISLPSSIPLEAACLYPGDILNLTNWKQTLPIGSERKPEEIKQALLNTFFHKSYFQTTSACDGVVFRAPVNGVTTSGSGYPRSELREMVDSGKNLASWSTTSGTHAMYIEQAITAVPKTKKHVVAGQIHDGEDDVIVIRLEHPKLFIDINGEDGPVLDPNYTLGKKFDVRFVAQDGKIQVYYNGGEAPAHTLSKKGSGNYFKAGAYTQSNCTKESDCSESNYGEVVIYKLLTDHSGSTLASLAAKMESSNTSAPTAEGAEEKSPEESKSDEKSETPGASSESQPASESETRESAPTSEVVSQPETPEGVGGAPVAEPVVEPVSDPIIQDGRIAFEAESGALKSPMLIASSNSASQGQYVVQTSKKSKGTVKYTVTVPKTGRYQLWAKVVTPDGSSNSLYYKVGNKSYKKWNFPSKLTDWAWTQGPTVTLSEGTSTFTIKKRERNTQIDAFEFRPIEQYSVLPDFLGGLASTSNGWRIAIGEGKAASLLSFAK